jgi:soluble P-type ATPase
VGARVYEADGFTSLTGRGIKGNVGGKPALLGNLKLFREQGISVDEKLAGLLEQQAGSGRTAILVGYDGVAIGVVTVSDPIKSGAREAIAALRADGVSVVMATGDAKGTAEAVGRELGLSEVQAGMAPEDKHTLIEALKQQGKSVAFAGDGVNDAPALAAADVGVAMGTGADVAIESAGITLLKGELSGHRQSAQAVEGDAQQHQAEPAVRLRLQRAGHPGGSRCALPADRLAALANAGRGGHGAELGERHRQCAAAELGEAVAQASAERVTPPVPPAFAGRGRGGCALPVPAAVIALARAPAG